MHSTQLTQQVEYTNNSWPKHPYASISTPKYKNQNRNVQKHSKGVRVEAEYMVGIPNT